MSSTCNGNGKLTHHLARWKRSVRKRLKHTKSWLFRGINQRHYIEQILTVPDSTNDLFVPITPEPIQPEPQTPKAIAFYLPQFHCFPENDAWWGRGFTEWTNVAKAVPQFLGHYQPRQPIDVGYYDLRVPEVMRRQVQLAQLYGLFGFCFHYYWFSGKRLMELPLERYLADTSLDFPFCFCWANEPWTRRWDGLQSDVLMAQNLLDDDDQKFIEDLVPYFIDSRYIRVEGKPLLIIYHPRLWSRDRVLRLTSNMRNAAILHGFKGLYLVSAHAHGFADMANSWGFDAGVEFPPHHCQNTLRADVEIINKNFKGPVYDMRALVATEVCTEYAHKVFRTVFPSWDNVARTNNNGHVFYHSSPALYKEWLSSILKYTYRHNSPTERFVFINAWNEWAEGAYLEPDRKYGYAYLHATGEALRDFKPEK